MEIIDQGGEALNKVLVYLRDKPEDPCLIHCTGSWAPQLLQFLRD